MFEKSSQSVKTEQAETGPQVLTHSRAACFRTCPRKHYLRYELGLSADTESEARAFGSAFHLALEMWAKGIPFAYENLGLEDIYEQAKLAALFEAHVRRYHGEELETVAAELEFDLPLVNPETGRPTSVWTFGGKVDEIVRLADGRLALRENKTTTQDFTAGSDYWLRLHLDSQLSLYVNAARALGYDVETIIYDVSRRPMLRPKMATPEDQRKYKKDGTLYANQRDVDETPVEFYERVAADIAERPDYYFARIEIARLQQDLDDCAMELWQQQLAIRNCQKMGHWYRNPAACHGFFKCDYLPICQNRDLETVTPRGFVRREEVHPELSGAASVEG